MSLKIRLARGGAKKRPYYSIVVADSRSPRDGRFIEKLGTYNPMLDRSHADRVTLKAERIQHWLGVGALPTDRVARFLGDAGLIEKPRSPTTRSSRAEGRRRRRREERREGRRPKLAGRSRPPERRRGASSLDGSRGEGRDEGQPSGFVSASSPAPHGVQGAVRIKSFTEVPEDVARYGPLDG